MDKDILLGLYQKIKSNQLKEKDISLVNQLFFSYEENESYDFDVIVVLGGTFLNRIQTAVTLYQKNKSLLLISGGSRDQSNQLEWEKYANYALSHGVSRKKMIIEGESTNTYENLLNSCQILIYGKYSFSRVLFISSSQHLLRVSLTLSKIFLEKGFSFQYSLYPSYSRNIRKENWYLCEDGRIEIMNEIMKIIQYDLISYF